MKKIVILAASLIMVATLSAEQVKGPYVGIGFGSTSFDDGGYINDLSNYAGFNINKDFSSNGLKIYGGYQFNNVVAIEASYITYGKHSISAGTLDAYVDPTALSIYANVGYNLGTQQEFRPFAILGLSNFQNGQSDNILSGGDFYEKDSFMSIHAGLGFEYNPVVLNGFGFRVMYEGDFYTVDSDNGSSYFDSEYSNNVTMLSLSAHYKF